MKYKTFNEFYPFYLGEHANLTCRKLHFIGTSCVIALVVGALLAQRLEILWFVPVVGYGFAWLGHFVFEKNRPATFKYPFYSLLGDFRMFWEILTGKLKAF